MSADTHTAEDTATTAPAIDSPVQTSEIDIGDDPDTDEDLAPGAHIFARLGLTAAMRRKLTLVQQVYRLPSEASTIRACLFAGLPIISRAPIPKHLAPKPAAKKKGFDVLSNPLEV